jgi:catechol 2,3-dioxygenase-like lactoylglutathione lyase family enzyme
MALRAIHHVQLAMPRGREDEARAFYEGLLGIPEVPKPPERAARGGCWFEQGALKVHLGVEEDFRPARKAHPAFIVDGLRGLTDRLMESGCPTTIIVSANGDRTIHVDDPFGNRIELTGPPAEG